MGKVLVIRGGALGDFILTLPAIRLLSEGLENAQVHILGYSPMIQLATLAGLAVETRRIEHTPLARFFVPNTELDDEWQHYFASFDVIISYLHDPESIFRANLLRSGVKETNLFEGIHQVVNDPDHGHAVHQLARPLQSLALYLDHPNTTLNLNSENRDGIAIHPGSGAVWKNWPPKRWLDLLPDLRQRLASDEPLIVISGEAEEAWIDNFIAEATSIATPVQHWRNLPLESLAQNLANVRAFIGHDTGVSHLAAAAGAPTFALFGATNPRIWAPLGDHVHVLRTDDDKLLSITPAMILNNLDAAKI